MTLPVEDPQFWQDRINSAMVNGRPHESVYIVSTETWSDIQVAHAKILKGLIHPGMRVLDAGCAYGRLLDLLPAGALVAYTGIDLSPDFIALAKMRHPGARFEVADIRKLPYPDQSFDLAICASIEGMIIDNLGQAIWLGMERELLRVASRVALLCYSRPNECRVICEPTDPTENTFVAVD